MNCERCGANLALVGRTHRCVPHKVSTVPHTVPHKPGPKEERAQAEDPGKETGRTIKKGDAQRVAKWKAANRDKHLAYHRELMRKRRATPVAPHPK